LSLVGHVTGLFVYPVKGLRGVALDEAEVAPAGLAGDRRWMVVRPDGRFLSQRDLGAMARIEAVPAKDGLTLRQDGAELPVSRPQGGEVLNVTVWRDTVPALTASEAADAWLSVRLGQPCRLVHLADEGARPVDPGFGRPEDRVSFADGYPLLLTSEASLAALNDALPPNPSDASAEPVPMSRFRANVIISGAAAWAETGWRRLRIGSGLFRMSRLCTRCVVVTRDQRSGDIPRPGEPLRTLGRLTGTKDGIVFGINLIPDAPFGRIALGDPVELADAA